MNNNFTTEKFDRRRKYYLVLDCETATLPFVHTLESSADKKKISIAKPLIYDLGWQIIDRKGRVYERKNYLISEIFSVPSIFNTAYYASKRPIYIDLLEKNEIILTDWKTASNELVKAMSVCHAVGAYNSMFDFKKAIPFTEDYINALYSSNFYSWEEYQNARCKDMLHSKQKKSSGNFNKYVFTFRDVDYPLFDIWGLSCKHLINNDEYKKMCTENNWETESGKYFKTSAETTYRYIKKNTDFDEAHTALDDAIIESEILSLILKPKASNMQIGILYFPFRILGTVDDFNY